MKKKINILEYVENSEEILVLSSNINIKISHFYYNYNSKNLVNND